MSDYMVAGSDLTSIADAIRTKGSTSDDLAFPNGFIAAIGNIPSGEAPTLISKSITANGTYHASSDDADGYSSVSVSVAPRYVTGTFQGSTAGAAISVSVPYTGSGYPIAGIIYPSAGAYKADSIFYDAIQNKLIGVYAFAKCDTSAAPDYSSASGINDVVNVVWYKNSDSSATTYSSAQSIARILNQASAQGNDSRWKTVRMASATEMSVYIAGTGEHGFLNGVEYTYHIIYSN